MKNKSPNKLVKRHHFSIQQQPTYKPKSQQKINDKQQKIQITPYVKQYKKSYKPQIELQRVRDKIDIEAQSKVQVKQRQYQNDFYIKFDYNPFNNQSKNKIIHDRVRQGQDRKKISLVNIVSVIGPEYKPTSSIRDQTVAQAIQQIRNIKNNFPKSNIRTNNIKQNISNTLNGLDQKQQKSQRKQLNENNDISRLTADLRKQLEYKLLEMQIQQIALVRQPNFFLTKNKKINVFKLVRDQIRQINAFDHLKKHKFCMDGVIQNRLKFRLPIYRDISYFSRIILTSPASNKQNVLHHLHSEQLILNLKQLTFIDILSVASNRISPQFLNKKLNNQYLSMKQNASESSQQMQNNNQIIYRRIQQNRQTCTNEDYHQIQEIIDYQKYQLRKTQRQHAQRYKNQRQGVLTLGKIQNQLAELTINDEKTHQQLGTRTKQMIKTLLNTYINKKQQNKSANNLTSRSNSKSTNLSIDGLVSHRKKNFDRLRNVKLKSFKQMLKQKNQLSNIKNQVSRTKSPVSQFRNRNNSTIT